MSWSWPLYGRVPEDSLKLDGDRRIFDLLQERDLDAQLLPVRMLL